MLHPQAQALLTMLVERGVPPTHTLTPKEARALYRERRTVLQPDPPAVAETRELVAEGPHGSIPLRLYKPAGTGGNDARALPVLIYFHGGGWVIGDLDTHDTLCRQLANASGAAVIAVDYRMGPEHRFPAAVDDCIAATAWVQREASRLGLDPMRVAVGGDSAGGNLAAVVSIAARDARDGGDLGKASDGGDPSGAATPALAFQLLIYPATDQRRNAPSHTTNGNGYLLTHETITYFHDHYITDPAHDLDWRASPLLRVDLQQLPPALVLTAGYDPLRDEGLAYAEALTAAGNRATYLCFERQIHGFITMGRVLDEANSAVATCAAELRRAFG